MTQPKAGFSLFEVLIAFTIMSIVLVALIPGQARLLGRATEGAQNSLAMDYALSRSAELGITSPIQLGTTSDPYRNWTVAQATQPVERVENGQIVETTIEVLGSNGRVLAQLTSLGFIADEQ